MIYGMAFLHKIWYNFNKENRRRKELIFMENDFMENDKNMENDTQPKYINGKRMTYKAAEAAEQIGVPTSTLRNMTVKLEHLIDPIQKTQGGHRLYSEHNIAQLKEIRKIMEEKNYTLEHMIEYLSEPDALKAIIPESVDLDDNIYMNVIAKVVESKLDDYFNNNLEELTRKIDTAAEEMTGEIRQLKQKIEEMSEEQKKINREAAAGNEILTRERDEAYEQLKLKEAEIEDLKIQLENRNRKKFSLFGIGRRGE